MGGNGRGVRTRVVSTYLLLFVFFGGLYFGWGLAMGKAGGYAYVDAALSADHLRVIRDLTAVGGDHDRTDVHPLFVLLLNPVGVLLTKGLGSRVTAAALMNSVAGALCVVMVNAFLRRAGLSELISVIFAATLGLSSTHIFFGSTPETWIFAAAGVILLFNLTVLNPGSTARFLPAGVFAVGMVTTNLVAAAVAYAVSMYKRVTFATLIAKTAVLGIAVTACTAALSVVQKLLYPRSTIFFIPEVYRFELGSYSPVVRDFNDLTAGFLLSRAGKVAAVFLLNNVVAPATAVGWYSAGEFCLPLKPFVEVELYPLGPLGFVAAALWLGLIIWAAYSFIRNKTVRTPVLFGLLLTLAFNLGFYFFYGTTLYVYSISTAFPLLAAAALALRPYDRPGTRRRYVLIAALTCFGLLLLFNNLAFLYRIYMAFHNYPFPAAP